MTRPTKADLQKKLKIYMEQATMASHAMGDISDRNALAARYLQVLRATINTIGGEIKPVDFDRVLDILQQDRYLEGF